MVAQVAVAAADPVADRAMGALDLDPEQARVRDPGQQQDRGRDPDQRQDRGRDPDQRQDQGRMPGQAKVKDRGPVQVTDPVTEQAMMVTALRTVQVLDRGKRMFSVS